jgi:hypothetical protein
MEALVLEQVLLDRFLYLARDVGVTEQPLRVRY